jgi:hypothetical protein
VAIGPSGECRIALQSARSRSRSRHHEWERELKSNLQFDVYIMCAPSGVVKSVSTKESKKEINPLIPEMRRGYAQTCQPLYRRHFTIQDQNVQIQCFVEKCAVAHQLLRLVSVAGAVATSRDGSGLGGGLNGVRDVAGRCAGRSLSGRSAGRVSHGGGGSAGRVTSGRGGSASGVSLRRGRSGSRVRLHRACGVRSGLRARVDDGRARAGLGAGGVTLRL